jgi:hypothetical protein
MAKDAGQNEYIGPDMMGLEFYTITQQRYIRAMVLNVRLDFIIPGTRNGRRGWPKELKEVQRQEAGNTRGVYICLVA